MKKFVILLTIVLLSSCNFINKNKFNLNLILPRETDVPGWELVNDNSYKLSNSKMVKNYKPIANIKNIYKSYSNNNLISIEIFQFKETINAFGPFSIERNKYNKFISIKDNYFHTEDGLFAFTGKFYYMIKYITLNESSAEEFLQFTDIIEKNLKKYAPIKSLAEKFPDYIQLFSENYSNRKLIFYINSFPYFDALKNVFMREKNLSEQSFRIFFSKKSSQNLAMNNFLSIIKNKNSKFIFSDFGTAKSAYTKINNKFLYISLYKNWIFGVIDADNVSDGHKISMKLKKDIIIFISK